MTYLTGNSAPSGVNSTATTLPPVSGLDNSSMTNDTQYDENDPQPMYPSAYDYELFLVTNKMQPIHVLFFVIIGMIGNSLALIVILQKSMRGVSSAVYVAVLAMADNLTLFAFFIGMVAYHYFLNMYSDEFCRFYYYILSTGSMTSAWTVVAMTFERALVVTFPLKAPNWTSRTKAAVIECVICVVCILINIHFFWTMQNNMATCQYNYATYEDLIQIYSLFDTFMAFYLPVIFVFILNFVIIIQMKRARRFQKTMTNAPSSLTPATKQQPSSQGRSQSDTTNQITVMLLSVSICFFICMAPYAFFQVYYNYIIDISTASLRVLVNINFANQFFSILWEANHSINVVLYSLTGRKFRQAMMNLFTCGKYGTEKRGSMAGTTKTTATSTSTVNTVA